jgi:hypothetical protein
MENTGTDRRLAVDGVDVGQWLCRANGEELAQSLAVIRLAKGRRVRREMVQAARAALPSFGEPFEKDGETFVGRLALRFDADGAFVDVRAP